MIDLIFQGIEPDVMFVPGPELSAFLVNEVEQNGQDIAFLPPDDESDILDHSHEEYHWLDVIGQPPTGILEEVVEEGATAPVALGSDLQFISEDAMPRFGTGFGFGPSYQSANGDDGPPIIVNGYRINRGGGGGGSGGGSGFFDGTMYTEQQMLSRDIAVEGMIPDEPDDMDPPKVAADLADPANAAQVQQAAEELTAEVDRLTSEINSLSDSAQIQLANGTILTGAQLKDLWARIDFVVTDRTFGPGRSGAYDASTRTATMNAGDLLGYDLHTNGLAFVVLHEVVHSSPEGREIDRVQWESYLARGGLPNAQDYANSPEFSENEEFANVGALRAAIQLGVNPIFDGSSFAPEHGYEYGDLGS